MELFRHWYRELNKGQESPDDNGGHTTLEKEFINIILESDSVLQRDMIVSIIRSIKI